MLPLAVPLHMGALHPMESLLMAALALGPFVALAIVVTVVSRRDRRTGPRQGPERVAEQTIGQTAGQRRGPAGQATRAADAARPDATSTTDTPAPQSVQQ